MKVIWKSLVVVGIATLLYAAMMDTTVSSSEGRIFNIGLQQDRNLVFTLGCFLILLGVVLFAVVKLKQTPEQEQQEQQEQQGHAEARAKGRERIESGAKGFSAYVRATLKDRPFERILGALLVLFTLDVVRHAGLSDLLVYIVALALAFWPRPAVLALRDLYALCATAAALQLLAFISVAAGRGDALIVQLGVVVIGAAIGFMYYRSRARATTPIPME